MDIKSCHFVSGIIWTGDEQICPNIKKMLNDFFMWNEVDHVHDTTW